MAYFFITDDNKIYAGGYDNGGHTGTNTATTSSSYNYSVYPPKEIIYETLDGTTLHGDMIKEIVSGDSVECGSLLLTSDGSVFASGGRYAHGAGASAAKTKIFKKIELDKVGNPLPKIKRICAERECFLLSEEGKVYSCGLSNGRMTTVDYHYDIISTDIDGNLIPEIVDISSCSGHTALLAKDGAVYTFGSTTPNGIYDENFTSHAVYYPIKAKIRDVVKVVSIGAFGFICLDKFGEVWMNGNTTQGCYKPYSGKYYDGNDKAPYVNFNKLDILDLYVKINGDANNYPFPKKIVDIIGFKSSCIIKYLDEEGKVNLLTTNGNLKYLGAGTTPTGTLYWYNAKNSTGFWDFENEYDDIYNFDNNGIASLKDGKLYVAGGKGTVGGTVDKFTAPVIMPNTEELNIVKVFGASNPPILKEEPYPMPDISKSKVKIKTMV